MTTATPDGFRRAAMHSARGSLNSSKKRQSAQRTTSKAALRSGLGLLLHLRTWAETRPLRSSFSARMARRFSTLASLPSVRRTESKRWGTDLARMRAARQVIPPPSSTTLFLPSKISPLFSRQYAAIHSSAGQTQTLPVLLKPIRSRALKSGRNKQTLKLNLKRVSFDLT